MTAFVAPVTPRVDIAATAIVTAKEDDIRRGRTDDGNTAAIAIHIAYATG
jgi:hypothetical protein